MLRCLVVGSIVTCSIGYGIARRLARDGCKVMISSRKESNVASALARLRDDLGGDAQQGKVEGMVCHVGKEADRDRLVSETVARFGGMDILVSNAAANPFFGPTLQVKCEVTRLSYAPCKVLPFHFLHCSRIRPVRWALVFSKKRGLGSC